VLVSVAGGHGRAILRCRADEGVAAKVRRERSGLFGALQVGRPGCRLGIPRQEGLHNVNRPEDKENCTALMADLRAALDKAGERAGKRYLLTWRSRQPTSGWKHTEMDKVAKSLDFANLMAYDQFEPGGDPMAGHHAPLFTHPANPKHLSAATAVSHFIAAGVPAAKVVLGVPFYGHAWGEVPASEHGLYQSGKKPKQQIYEPFDMIDSKTGKPRRLRTLLG